MICLYDGCTSQKVECELRKTICHGQTFTFDLFLASVSVREDIAMILSLLSESICQIHSPILLDSRRIEGQ